MNTENTQPSKYDPIIMHVKKDAELVPFMRDLLVAANIPESILLNSDLYVNDDFFPCELWEITTIKKGDKLELYPNVYAVGGAIVTAIAGSAFAATTAGVIIATTISFVVTAAVSFGLNALMTALFPTEKPKVNAMPESESLPQIQGATNPYRPYEYLPALLGVRKVVPDHAVQYYSHVVNGKQEIRHLFCVCAGYAEVWDIRKDNTNLYDLGVQIQVHKGWTGWPFRWFNTAVLPVQEQFSLRDYAQYVGESPINTTAFTAIITFAGGLRALYLANSSYSDGYATINVFLVDTISGWTVSKNFYITGKALMASYRESIHVPLPVVGKWKVYLTGRTYFPIRGDAPLNNVSNKEYQFSVEGTITEIQWILNEPAVVYTGQSLTLIEVNAVASDKLTGGLNTINCMAECWGVHGNGQRTQGGNLACLARRALTDPNLTLNSEYSVIDEDSFFAFENHCYKYGFTASVYEKEGRTLREVLSELVAIGQGYITNANGVWKIAFDSVDSPVVDVINSRNSWGTSKAITMAVAPVDEIRVRFINKYKDYQHDEVRCSDSGIVGKNSISMANDMIDDPTVAWKWGMLQLAMQTLRKAAWTTNTDWRSINYELGAKIIIQLPEFFLGVGTAGKMIRHYQQSDGASISVLLDQEYPLEANKQYVLRESIQYGARMWDMRVYETGNTNILYFTTPIYASNLLPRLNEFYIVGESSKIGEYVSIRNITRNANFSAEIEAIRFDSRFYDAITGDIPDFVSNLTFPNYWANKTPSQPVIHKIYVLRETVYKDNLGKICASANISFSSMEIQGVEISYFRIGIKSVNENEYTYYNTDDKYNFVIPKVCQNENYSITLVAYSYLGLHSLTTTFAYTPNELMENLQAVDSFSARHMQRGQELTWLPISDWRPFEYELYRGKDGDSFANANLIGVYQEPTAINVHQVGLYYLRAKSGYAYSPLSILEIENVIGDGFVANVLAKIDERSTQWDDKNNSFVVDSQGSLVLLTGGDFGVFESTDIFNQSNVFFAGYTGNQGIYELREEKNITLTTDAECYVTFELDYFAQSTSGDVFNNTDIFNQSNVFDIVSGVGKAHAEILVRNKGTWAKTWLPLTNTSYNGDGFRFRIVAESDSNTLLYIEQFNVLVDVPDRIYSAKISVPVGGIEHVYPIPYNALPKITAIILNTESGNNIFLDDALVTKEKFFVEVRNSEGVSIAKDINISVQGY